MELKDIQNEINSRYAEIYNRIKKYFDKFKYAENIHKDKDLYDWYFNYEEGIEVLMRNYDGDEDTVYIDPKFLETDEVFEKWINDKYAQRKEKDDAVALNRKAIKDKQDFEKYQELKAKFEKQ
jgi:hypothetical protein